MVSAGEVVCYLHFASDVEVGAAEVASYVVPELGFSEEHPIGGLYRRSGDGIVFTVFRDDEGKTAGGGRNDPGVALAPDVEEAAEGESVDAQEVLHAPYDGELQGSIVGCDAANLFIHQLEGEGVAIVGTVEEILDTEEPAVVGVLTAVPLGVETQGGEGGAFPEVDRATDLGIISVGGHIVRMIDIVEEESASPFVGLEHLEGGGEMTAVKIVHLLDVYLGFYPYSAEQ